MKRRTLLLRLPAALFVPPSALAQTAGRVYRLGYLAPGPAPKLSDALITALRDRGWGSRNLFVDLRYTQGNQDHAERLARELVNVTGMTVYADGGGLFGKFLELLRELRPSLRELGMFWGWRSPFVLRGAEGTCVQNRALRGPHPSGRAARRPPDRATDEVRTDGQRQGCEGHRAEHSSALLPRADRVIDE